MRALFRSSAFALGAIVLGLLPTTIASADGPGWRTVSQDFQGLLFGLNTGHGDELLVADAFAGPTRLYPDDGETSPIAQLFGNTGVIQIGRREYVALTGGFLTPTIHGDQSLYRIRNGNVTKIADLLEFEVANNPDGGGIDSNPFDLAKLGPNKVLVADAAGNSLLVVNRHGNVDWVATFPPVDLANPGGPCPTQPPAFCSDAVPTSVAIGPDGYAYVGELTGFPGTPGFSRVWRVDPDARHVQCRVSGGDDDCTLVDTGPLTSIVDISFDDGTAYVVELDEASWLAVDFGEPPPLGGTVNSCRAVKGNDDDEDDDEGDGDIVAWRCKELATGLPAPLAVALDDKSVYVTLAFVPDGPFEVARLTRRGSRKRASDQSGNASR